MGIRIQVTDQLASAICIGLEQRGRKIERTFTVVDAAGEGVGHGRYVATQRLEYVCLPISFEVCLWHGNLSPYLKAGPELGIFMSGDLHSVTTYPAGRQVEDRSVGTEIEGTDISLLMGAGVAWSRPIPLYLECRYLRGMTDVAGARSEWRTKAIVALIGFRIT